jgi:hypothetical protein
MMANRVLILRILLLLLLTGFVAGFAASQYDMVRSLVTVICTSCVGIG